MHHPARGWNGPWKSSPLLGNGSLLGSAGKSGVKPGVIYQRAVKSIPCGAHGSRTTYGSLSSAFREDALEDEPTHEQIQRAQALVGELLWASIRTRPDVAYAVSKLASTLSRAPDLTYKVGLQTLAYLTATSNVALTYWREDRAIWENFKRSQDLTGCVEGYGDASFAPEARKSMQCVQVYVEGNLVA